MSWVPEVVQTSMVRLARLADEAEAAQIAVAADRIPDTIVRFDETLLREVVMRYCEQNVGASVTTVRVCDTRTESNGVGGVWPFKRSN